MRYLLFYLLFFFSEWLIIHFTPAKMSLGDTYIACLVVGIGFMLSMQLHDIRRKQEE